MKLLATILMLLSFATGAEVSKDLRIDLNDSKSIYLIPQLELDIKELVQLNNSEDSVRVNISIIFEF